MKLSELNREQKIQLKENILVEKLHSPSLGELLDSNNLVSDEELEEKFGGTEFVDEDFTTFEKLYQVNIEGDGTKEEIISFLERVIERMKTEDEFVLEEEDEFEQNQFLGELLKLTKNM